MAYGKNRMTKLISVDLYCRNILFHFGTKSELERALKRYHDKETINYIIETIDFDAHGFTLYDSVKGVFVVYMPKLPDDAASFGFLSHEIFHASTAIMDAVGVELSESSEEAYAYLVGYLTRKVLSAFPISFS